MPYTVLDQTYEDIFSLSKDMYLRPDIYCKELRKQEFLDFVNQQDPLKAQKINALAQLSTPDEVLVFRAGEIINPFMSFRFNRYLFEDYESLGKALLASAPNTNSALSLIVRFGLVSEHMQSTCFQKTDPALYEKVKAIENESSKDLTYAYFSLGFLLYHSSTIIYDHKEYKDIYNLTFYLIKKEKDLTSLGAYLSFSPLLKAYSEYAPNGQDIKDYLHLCESVDQSENDLNEFLLSREEKSN